MLKLDDPGLLRADAFVDGGWSTAASGARFAVRNPSGGAVLAEVADLAGSDARAAIEAAAAAQAGWAALTAKARHDHLMAWHAQILAAREDLARLMTAEQGKPLTESRGEIAYGAAFIEWFAEEGRRAYGAVIPPHRADARIVVLKQPVGVAAAITPWNFPNAMITRKAAPALAAGCTFLVKPAAETPLSALALAELADRAGLPKGVFNVLPTTRSAEVGAELTGHPLVRKFSFTGSTAVGSRLMAQCAETIKKVSLELGGNAPFIVFDDADLDRAAAGAMVSKYRNMGQTCVCANRFLVQAGVFDAFAAKLTEKAGRMTLGDGAQPGVDQGPLINEDAVVKVEGLLAEAQSQGARVLLGGHRHALGGSFFEPTVITGVTPNMAIFNDEIFGPVASLTRFETEAEAVALANATPYGLAAYFYASDLSRVFRVAEQLEYGMIGVNEGLISTEVAPFGGVKQSGLGREGSQYGLDEYLELKYLLIGL
ncbi:MAG TPA: NAD-dependent succinate-semialdehyde dehydrogenase [Caulobacteraceae bacterium]|jgi:succinate-semialdehyde dehydrogenase/glutarate-semialdehyde dehydrogenase